jgi:signal transduction histidine kinase
MKTVSWKSSPVLRVILYVLFIVGISGLFVSGFSMIVFYETGIIYDARTYDEAKRILDERIAQQYSIVALTGQKEGQEAAGLADTNFRYGIIQGYSLEEAKEKEILEDPKSYSFQNFEAGIPDAKERFVHSYTYANGQTDYYVPYSLFEDGYLYFNGEDSDWEDKENQYIVVSTIAKASYDPALNDLYRYENDLLQAVYSYKLKELLPVIAVFAAVLIAVCTILLLNCAGWKRNGQKQELIVLKKTDLFPLDIGTVIALVLFLILFGEGAVLSYELCHNNNVWETQWTIVLLPLGLVLAAGLILLTYLMSVAANVKAGGVWERTALSKLCRVINRGYVRAREKDREAAQVKDLKRRVWSLFAVFTGVEALALFFITQYFFSARVTLLVFLLWTAEKIVLAVIVSSMLWQFAELKVAGMRLADGDFTYCVDTEKMMTDLAIHGEDLNRIKDGMEQAISERLKSEHFQTELITNVSHDIKTPLTSIINYIDLLSKEELPGEKAKEYVEVLTRQSKRLKKLVQDLIDASRASSGNVKLNMEEIDLNVLLSQMAGEYFDKMSSAGIELVVTKPDAPVLVTADSQSLCRVFDNLLQHIVKYAQKGTRAYVDLAGKTVIFRNTSAERLNISAEELLQRFVQGDASRKAEGSGLGLSIAENLMKLMGGMLKLSVDGDLFKVTLEFS